jgi:hypothetical protein
MLFIKKLLPHHSLEIKPKYIKLRPNSPKNCTSNKTSLVLDRFHDISRFVLLICLNLHSVLKAEKVWESMRKCSDCCFCSTVQLGYNDHCYYEYTVITNKIKYLVWFSMFYQKDFMDITNKVSEFHGYNEHVGNFFLAKLIKIMHSKKKILISSC